MTDIKFTKVLDFGEFYIERHEPDEFYEDSFEIGAKEYHKQLSCWFLLPSKIPKKLLQETPGINEDFPFLPKSYSFYKLKDKWKHYEFGSEVIKCRDKYWIKIPTGDYDYSHLDISIDELVDIKDMLIKTIRILKKEK